MSRRERELRKLAARYGFDVEPMSGGHWRLQHPDGRRVIAAKSPSDSGHLRLLEGCLRRSQDRQTI